MNEQDIRLLYRVREMLPPSEERTELSSVIHRAEAQQVVTSRTNKELQEAVNNALYNLQDKKEYYTSVQSSYSHNREEKELYLVKLELANECYDIIKNIENLIKKSITTEIDKEKIKAFDKIQEEYKKEKDFVNFGIDVDDIMEVANETIIDLLQKEEK